MKRKIKDQSFFIRDTILGVGKRNFFIYLAGLIISFSFIIPYFWCENSIISILMSIGASGVGAIILAYFIEKAGIARDKENKQWKRESLMQPIIFDLQNSFCCFVSRLYLQGFNINFSKNLIYNINAYCEQEKDKMIECGNPEIVLDFNVSRFFSYGLLNYGCNDIINNRSNNVFFGIFNDYEIKTIKVLQIHYKKMLNSSSKWEFITSLQELLFDLHDEVFFQIKSIKLKKNENDLEFYLGEKKLIIFKPI